MVHVHSKDSSLFLIIVFIPTENYHLYYLLLSLIIKICELPIDSLFYKKNFFEFLTIYIYVSVRVCRCLQRREEGSTDGCVYFLTWVLVSEFRFFVRGPALSVKPSFQPQLSTSLTRNLIPSVPVRMLNPKR